MALKSNLTTLSKLEGPDEQKAQILKSLGDLKQYELLSEDVLVAIYIESNVLSTGADRTGKAFTLYKPDTSIQESRFQGKAFLLLAKGPQAFRYLNNGQPYEGVVPEVGDWVAALPSDGREIQLRDAKSKGDWVLCRKMHWSCIGMRVSDPRVVY